MSAKAFIDTNILVYAHDAASGIKYEQAKSLLRQLWIDKTGVLSTQVLQEFYVTVRKKVLQPGDSETAKRWISYYLNWQLVENDGPAILRAIAIEERYKTSFWDALIIQAANKAGAQLLYSEDLNHEQIYGNVQVKNPFNVQSQAAITIALEIRQSPPGGTNRRSRTG